MNVSSEPITSTARARDPRRTRRLLVWALIAAFVLALAAVAVRVAVQIPEAHNALDPEGAGPTGTLALAEILRDQGVDVTVARTRADAMAAIGEDTTLVMPDPPALSDEAVTDLLEPATRTVVLSATSRMLRLLDIGTRAMGVPVAVTADCDWAPFARVGEIVPDRTFSPAAGVTGCFVDDEGSAAVLIDTRGGDVTALVQGTTLFSNAYLADDGNAALGIALMAQTGHVVWYVPSAADSDLAYRDPETLGTLTPGWVTPAILLLLLAGVAAALWRGRRFGPLVAETLPVTVRASETMHGRARLVAKAADAAHAASALRTGSLLRLSRRLALGEHTAPAAVAAAVTDRLRLPHSSLDELLTGPLPQSDPELIDFARRLDALERAVDAAVHTERNTP